MGVALLSFDLRLLLKNILKKLAVNFIKSAEFYQYNNPKLMQTPHKLISWYFLFYYLLVSQSDNNSSRDTKAVY